MRIAARIRAFDRQGWAVDRVERNQPARLPMEGQDTGRIIPGGFARMGRVRVLVLAFPDQADEVALAQELALD